MASIHRAAERTSVLGNQSPAVAPVLDKGSGPGLRGNDKQMINAMGDRKGAVRLSYGCTIFLFVTASVMVILTHFGLVSFIHELPRRAPLGSLVNRGNLLLSLGSVSLPLLTP
jgi:hypothetical protein